MEKVRLVVFYAIMGAVLAFGIIGLGYAALYAHGHPGVVLAGIVIWLFVFVIFEDVWRAHCAWKKEREGKNSTH